MDDVHQQHVLIRLFVVLALFGVGCRRHRAGRPRAPLASQTVSAAPNRTCVIHENRVLCVGRLGARVAWTPALIPGTEGAVALDDGGTFACLVRKDRSVACFGDHAITVPGLERVVQLAIGRAHGCARLDDGHVRCWPMNGAATEVPVRSVVALDADGDVTCATRVDRSHWCWGGTYGSTPTRVERPLPSPMGCALQGNVAVCGDTHVEDAAEVVASPNHACVRKRSGEIWCFGEDSFGQLGDREPPDAAPRRVDVGPGALSFGGSTACVLGESVTCWPDVAPFQPTLVPALAKTKLLRRGADHACAIDAAGALRCFGLARVGQLGRPSDEWSVLDPTVVEGLPKIADVAVGDAQTCARAGDDRVFCFGSNSAGQFALGSSSLMVATPTESQALRGARALALGTHHLCAVLPDATVACAGSNGSGELGSELAGSSPLLRPVAGLDRVTAVEAAGRHTCARREDGELLCWGQRFRSPDGPFGGKGVDWFDRPQSLATDVTAFAVGRHHACFVRAGDVLCFGDNGDGSCGAPLDGEVQKPRVALHDAVDVSVGDHASCARTKAGEVWCWGQGRASGAPATVLHAVPVRLRL